MEPVQFLASAFDFLAKLRENNNRNWFVDNKAVYQQQAVNVAAFAETMLQGLNHHDVIETVSGAKSLYRIYRDVRFSRDKTPYSTYWGGRFRRASKYRRGGYYYHFEPGDKSFVLCGFWSPNAQDLKLIRDDIAFDPTPLRDVLNDPTFISSFGILHGEKLKTSPKGYDNGHEAIDLLRYKQFLITRRFTDQEVLGADFLSLANQSFKNMRPFLDYMSEVLTTDSNGLKL
jgi:uncharacterized protein (TIGR02453 family)